MTQQNAVVELFYGNAWNDITALNHVFTDDPITIAPRGRPSETQRVPPSKCALSIDNIDGRYSPRNPMSPLYGLIGRNTPLRVYLRRIVDTFTRTVANGWGSTESGQPWAIGGGPASDYLVSSGAGKFSYSAINQSRSVGLNAPTLRDIDITYTLTLSATPTGDQWFTSCSVRRVSFNDRLTANVQAQTSGSVGLQLQAVVAGVNTFGPFLTIPAVTATTPMRVRVQAKGTLFRAKVWAAASAEPAAWLDSMQTSVVAAGAIELGSFLGSGVTNVLPAVMSFDNVEERDYRFTGEVEAWPSRWNVKGSDVRAPIEAWGILRRINAPGTVVQTQCALRRAILRGPTPVAYYPLEEGRDARQPLPYGNLGAPGAVLFADGYQPGQAGPTGTQSMYGVVPAGGSGGSLAYTLPGSVRLVVPDHAATGSEVLTMHVRWKPFDNPHVSDGATDADIDHRWEFKSGDIVSARLILDVTGGVPAINFAPSPDNFSSFVTMAAAAPNFIDGNWHEIQVRCLQNGGNIDLEIWFDGVRRATSTIVGKTLGASSAVVLGVDGFYFNGSGTLKEGVYEASHITVHTTNTVGQFYAATIGHVGETAVARLTRLCAEEGVTLRVIGTSLDKMGQQRIATVPDLWNDAVDVDGGILFESRDELGLTYRTRTSLYNQGATITASYAAGGEVAPPLEPLPDTDHIANDVTVKRYLGGQRQAVQNAGSLNIQPPPAGVGRYPIAPEQVQFSDDQLPQQAAWLLFLGTWDEDRYPAIRFDLDAMEADGKTALRDLATSLDIGDRLSVFSLPVWVSFDSVEQLVQGYTEVIESHGRTLAMNATPALPYDVFQVQNGFGNQSRLSPAAGATTLNGTMTTGATSVSIISAKTRWIDKITFPSQFPFDIIVAGERMRVTDCTGTGLTQTITVTRSINGVVKTHAVGEAVQLFRPPVIAR